MSSAAPGDIPSLDRLLKQADYTPLIEQYGRSQVVTVLRSQLQSLREQALAGTLAHEALKDIAAATAAAQAARNAPRLRAVFNLTGPG
ncbi:L-seryl-tRNA(Sec) selenium transferase, partial [Bordetella avium]